MAYTIFDAGFMDWFDNRHTTATISGNVTVTHSMTQVFDVTKADIAPGLAACFPTYGYSYGSSWIIHDSTKVLWLKRTLPELTTEGWFSQKLYYNHEYATSQGTSSAYITLMALENDTLEIASLRTIGYGQTNTGLVELFIGGVSVGSFALPQSTPNQLEVRCRVSETDGFVQVWLNGTLVLDFTGNTGTTAIKQVAYYSGRNCLIYVSSFVYSNERRIGNKLPVITWLSGPGTVADGVVKDFLGNWSGAGTWDRYATTTMSTAARFADAGTVTGFMINFYSAGTYKVGIVTVNANDPSKRTVKYMSDVLTASAAGVVNLSAGVNFPANWTVDTNDAVALYLGTAVIGAEATSAVDWSADGYHTLSYRLQNADGINTADATEKTYTLCSSERIFSFGATYAVADATKAYKITDTQKETIAAPKNNNNHYFSHTAAEQTNKFQIGDLPIPCAYIKTIKVTTSAVGNEELSRAEFIVDVNGAETTVTRDLPTSLASTDTYITGLWTPAEFNSAQIGIRSKAAI